MRRLGDKPQLAALVLTVVALTAGQSHAAKWEPPVYVGPEGWRIELVGFLDKDRATRIVKAVETLQRNGEFPGTCKLVKLQVEDGGEWVACEVMDFAGCRLQIWKDTRLIVTLKSGKEVKSLAIAASVDGKQTMLLDNRIRPFVVTETSVFGHRGPPELAVKLDAPVKPKEVQSIRFEGVVAKCK